MMGYYSPLWKYTTPAHCREFLLSLGLLGETDWPEDKQLACLYAVARHTDRHYHAASIPKRGGGERSLSVPGPLLKSIQRNILHNVIDGFSVSGHAMAYRPGLSVVDNARPHVGSAQVLKLDIADFFGSITYKMIYASAFPAVYFPAEVRTVLTHLCCLHDQLPQGAPTSAAISNLVLRPFDAHIGAWCGARGITYTRYCDDMTFSGAFDEGMVIRKVRAFLAVLGFVLNDEKTQRLTPARRQVVTGVVVNEKPQATRAYRRAVRQDVYYCVRYGTREHMQRSGEPDGNVLRYLRALLGRINFILQVNPDDVSFQKDREAIRGLIRTEQARVD